MTRQPKIQDKIFVNSTSDKWLIFKWWNNYYKSIAKMNKLKEGKLAFKKKW
jgi:hypothetical protein